MARALTSGREPKPRPILVAEIGAAHGLKGEVRLRSFTADPLAVKDYGTLEDERGRTFHIASLRPGKDGLIAQLGGISDRTAAEGLRGLKLYVPRDRLPPADDEDTFYHADLIGLAVVGRDGRALGTVIAVHNFGAGDLLEVRPIEGGAGVLVPFTAACVPTIEIEAGRLIVDPPVGTFG
jgi:16S rRNA processing protein RimM